MKYKYEKIITINDTDNWGLKLNIIGKLLYFMKDFNKENGLFDERFELIYREDPFPVGMTQPFLLILKWGVEDE